MKTGSARNRALALLAVVGILASCMPPYLRVHHSWLEATPVLPERVVLLSLARVSDRWDSMEEPEASRAAERVMCEVAASQLPGRGMECMQIDALQEHERSLVTEHLRALRVIADCSFFLHFPAGSPTWARVERFDQTLGPGLRFLAERTGADVGFLMVAYESLVLEPDRRHSDLYAALVDLRTGEILWLARDFGDELGDPDSTRKTLDRLLERFPGIDLFRSKVVDR